MSQAQFDKAVATIQSLPKTGGVVTPTQEEQLIFYKYYKQATIGDVNTTRPGMLDFVGKAKWDAWKIVEGVSKEDAQKAYVDNFIAVFKKVDSEESKKYVAEVEGAL